MTFATRLEDAIGVHVILDDGERICGDQWGDYLAAPDFETGPMRRTTKRRVTCPRCVDIVRVCKAVRI